MNLNKKAKTELRRVESSLLEILSQVRYEIERLSEVNPSKDFCVKFTGPTRKISDTANVSSLHLSCRTANCIENIGIETIGDLVGKTQMDLLKTKNFGRKSLREVEYALSTYGRSLAGDQRWL
jgi:DNA-directed RNA polymerase alpha subunit